MYKITYLPLAEADIIDAVDYISFTLEAPKAAMALLDELDKTVRQLSEFPYSCELYSASSSHKPMKCSRCLIFFLLLKKHFS